MKQHQRLQLALLVGLLASVSACASTPSPSSSSPNEPQLFGVDEPVGSVDQPELVPTSWKERLEQPYVYLEHIGDYRSIGSATRELWDLLDRSGIQGSGPPFHLYYDDPGRVPVELLRARSCVPIDGIPEHAEPGLRVDVLPRAMVVYTHVAGAYPDVPRVYPALFQSMQELGWTGGTPVRETYLVNPASVSTTEELITEVQIPWSTAR